MAPVKLLLDCDPGLDDALALLLAHGAPNLELVGGTTVGGNVGVENTTRNAIQVREHLGFDALTVAAGFRDYVFEAWARVAAGHPRA